MKILVFSDSHRSWQGMLHAVAREGPDMLLHLGDFLQDGTHLASACSGLPLVQVPGNCDGWTDQPLQRLITVEKKRILLSHGHVWHVKHSYHAAIAAGKQADAHILLFGHTHHAYCQQHEGMWVMNPGASRDSYGTILLQPGQSHCFITALI